MGVPDDIARIYLRFAPPLLMGFDEETAKGLAWRLEAEAQEGAAD
jgi:hypothetical protein